MRTTGYGFSLRRRYDMMKRTGVSENKIRETFGRLLIKWGEYKLRTVYKKNRKSSNSYRRPNRNIPDDSGGRIPEYTNTVNYNLLAAPSTRMLEYFNSMSLKRKRILSHNIPMGISGRRMLERTFNDKSSTAGPAQVSQSTSDVTSGGVTLERMNIQPGASIVRFLENSNSLTTKRKLVYLKSGRIGYPAKRFNDINPNLPIPSATGNILEYSNSMSLKRKRLFNDKSSSSSSTAGPVQVSQSLSDVTSGGQMHEYTNPQYQTSSIVNILEYSHGFNEMHKQLTGEEYRILCKRAQEGDNKCISLIYRPEIKQRLGRNDTNLPMYEPTDVDEEVPKSLSKEDVLMIAPTIKRMANPIQNEKITLSLFDYKNVYTSDTFKIERDILDKCKAIWFFGHGLDHYDKLDIVLPNDEKYDMTNFFDDNPDVHDIDFIFDVCYSSGLLLDYNFMQEVIKRNIRLYTCGFVRELNTPNGSFLSYCLKSIQTIVGNVFELTVKQINAWFSVISDMCGYKMYCYGKDDSVINPTPQEKQMAASLIKPFLMKYFRITGIKIFSPNYTNCRLRRINLKSNPSFGIN